MSLLRLPRLLAEKFPLSRSSLYEAISRGTFVPPIALGPRSVAWKESEVDAIIAARSAALDDDAVTNLVRELVAARSLPDAAAKQQAILDSSLRSAR
jgi:prophage regulatory protein